MNRAAQPIGVFDSGIGGLSVLQALRAELPHERFVYLADSGNAPYGDARGDAFVSACSTLRPPMPLSKTPMGCAARFMVSGR